MTDRFTAFSRGASNLSDTAKWINVSGATIPAYGVIQFKANFAAGYNQASKSDGSSGLYYANGPVAVGSGGHGESLIWNHSRLVLIQGTPIVGTVVGPVDDSWSMSEEGTGFLVLHQPVDGIGAVVQVGGGGTSGVIHGIVNQDKTRGYYLIEIAEWSGTTPVEDEVPDICLDATGSTSGSGDDNCTDIVLPEFESQLVGTGVYVLAYDPASVLVPLEIGSDCKLTNMGDENALGSASDSSGVTEPVFQILRGYQTHVTAYDKEYECCELTGEWRLISKKAYIFAAKTCDPAMCEPCPTE